MWSMHDFSFLRPAYSWPSSLSTAVPMHWGMIRQKTLLVMDSSVMSLQLLHLDKYNLFGSLMLVSIFHASGFTSLIQKSWRMC